jgi:hypothetical protein
MKNVLSLRVLTAEVVLDHSLAYHGERIVRFADMFVVTMTRRSTKR